VSLIIQSEINKRRIISTATESTKATDTDQYQLVQIKSQSAQPLRRIFVCYVRYSVITLKNHKLVNESRSTDKKMDKSFKRY
jgi:hypothetical protein